MRKSPTLCWSPHRLRPEFMNGLNYRTIIEPAKPLAGRRGSALNCYRAGGNMALLLSISFCHLILSSQTMKAAESVRVKGQSIEVIPRTLSVTNVIWDAERKTTNVMAGTDFGRLVFGFTNVSTTPLTILSVKTSCGCTTAQLPALPWKIPPGKSGQIGVRVNLAGKTGTLLKTLTVGTDKGTKILIARINIQPPTTPAMAEAVRAKNSRLAQANRQAVFNGECARCHIKSVKGKYGKQLYDSVCGICHEGPHRATMVPDLHKLKVPTSVDFWKTWISLGKANSLMPAFANTQGGPLSDAQIRSLATYLNATIPPHVRSSQ